MKKLKKLEATSTDSLALQIDLFKAQLPTVVFGKMFTGPTHPKTYHITKFYINAYY